MARSTKVPKEFAAALLEHIDHEGKPIGILGSATSSRQPFSRGMGALRQLSDETGVGPVMVRSGVLWNTLRSHE